MLETIFSANSLAFIGVSNSKDKGYQTINTLQKEGYNGNVFPVNAKKDSILGLKCYKSITDIEPNVNIAFITTPLKTIPSILKECGEKGVEGAILAIEFSMKVDESDLKNKILQTAKEYGIRLIDFISNIESNMNLSGIKNIPKGTVALLYQNKNIAQNLISRATPRQYIGFTHCVQVGKISDIGLDEYLEYFTNDPRTNCIILCVDSISEGRKFLIAAYKITIRKPVIMLSINHSNFNYDETFERSGIIVISDPDELLPAAEALANQIPIKNNNISILGFDGEFYTTETADLLSDYGVQLVTLSNSKHKKVEKYFSKASFILNSFYVNPIEYSDLLSVTEFAKIILQDGNVGGLIIVGLSKESGICFN